MLQWISEEEQYLPVVSNPGVNVCNKIWHPLETKHLQIRWFLWVVAVCPLGTDAYLLFFLNFIVSCCKKWMSPLFCGNRASLQSRKYSLGLNYITALHTNVHLNKYFAEMCTANMPYLWLPTALCPKACNLYQCNLASPPGIYWCQIFVFYGFQYFVSMSARKVFSLWNPVVSCRVGRLLPLLHRSVGVRLSVSNVPPSLLACLNVISCSSVFGRWGLACLSIFLACHFRHLSDGSLVSVF